MEMPGPIDEAEPEQECADAARGKSRDSMFLSAIVLFDGTATSQTVRVRNLSAGGMMIDVGAARKMGLGATIVLQNIGEIRGSVIWSTEKRLGIAFEHEIDPHLARRKPVTAKVPGCRLPLDTSRRPGLAIR
jgi:hypothetical protein